jgi:alkylation response protein AidB-like acyl-CoA dehydrogenase
VLGGDAGLVDGAARADWLIVAAAIEGGERLTVLVPRGAPGLRVGPPEEWGPGGSTPRW